MKCYYHTRRNTVATCQNCGVGLCKECAGQHIPCLCQDCIKLLELQSKQEVAQKKENYIIDNVSEFISAIIKGIIAIPVAYLILNILLKIELPFGEIMIFFFYPFGWTILSYIETFLPIPDIAIVNLIYLLLKAVFSIIIGVPAFIYQIIKFIIKLIISKKIK